MKRKILFATIISIVFIMTFALCAFAVDYNEKATLADGTVLPIYDENQNPLIWWISGEENGKNVYSSVPNNRNEANAQNDTYVTYTINTGYKTQLENINIHIWNDELGTYEIFTEENVQVVVVNLRGLSSFIYVNKGLKVFDIQYIYFNENLLDFCDYFKGSTSLRLVDLTVCTKMTGGFGGVRNFYQCSNLHTVRFAPTVSYSLKCSQNNNWRFSGTAVVSFVFPENITSIGIDNFKDCKQLESIYILGNNTSLGQRNFLNCPNLTNIYILGDNPQITTTEFAENFYSCVDGNKVLDFSNTGKYFFFATENSEYLENMRAAIEATAVVPYSSYKANPQNYTEGRYIISGITSCDALYNGEHIAGEVVNGCQASCERGCGALTVIENPTHVDVKTVTYGGKAEINYLSEIVVTVKCEKCGTVESEIVINNLFEEKGYSKELDSTGIVREFLVNIEAVEKYKQNVDSTFAYGMVVAIDDENPLKAEGGVISLNGDAALMADFTNSNYRKLQMKVVNISESAMDTVIVSTIYAYTNGEIYYANIGEMSKTAVGKTYNSLNK